MSRAPPIPKTKLPELPAGAQASASSALATSSKEGARQASLSQVQEGSPPLPSPGYTPLRAKAVQELVGATNFTTEEIEQLYKRFVKLDTDRSGTIDSKEFQVIPQLANNPLGQRLIDIFDEDGGGDVDFKEFIMGLSVFSSKCNREEKIKFAFKIYDMDRDGYISNGELFMVMKKMVGNNLTPVQLQQIVDKTIMEADQDGDGRISFDEFCAFVAKTDIVKQLTLESL
ncbi:Calcineurin subunit B [Spiromyces aspiralis]|uniref:Calcineurin subunit B n=1 Tax=Spiromyces aspiralis TaxID=68401 RepID=A0ACC1HT27_9FUNG|nr:Calcineurin subunit B [Spiromyces aspiralis]